jgi:hypothetical protein
MTLCPELEPRVIVQEELPVAGHCLPDQQERHRRCERQEARVVNRARLVAFVGPSHHESISHIGRNRKILQDVVKEVPCLIRGQVDEDDDDRLVERVVAGRLSANEESLVTADEIDDLRHAAVADMLGSEPQRLAVQGLGHEGTDRPSAAEILVRSDDEALDPARDGLKRIEIALRECARSADVLEILDQKEIRSLCWPGLCWHRTLLGSRKTPL